VQAIAGRLGGAKASNGQPARKTAAACGRPATMPTFACLQLKPGCRCFPTDVCVPISRLAECIAETYADIAQVSIPIALFGHVGDGNFHLVVLVDPTTRRKWPRRPGSASVSSNGRSPWKAPAPASTASASASASIWSANMALADHLDEKIDERLTALAHSANSVPQDKLNDLSALERHLQSKNALLTLFDDLYIFDDKGNLLVDWPLKPGRRGLDMSARDYIQEVRNNLKPFISQPILGKATKQPIVVTGRPGTQ
jgi:hypothetical protein